MQTIGFPPLELDADDLQDELYALGWTDGLPVVPPTPERVEAMLAGAGAVDPGTMIGVIPARGLDISLAQAAANAVLAGCLPEYFPIVVAALEAVLDESANPHAALTSTSSPALCVVVSGPLAAEVGMNARHNCLGPGNRANATIGRAVRLAVRNLLRARSEELDASALGQPAKYTFCFAEDPPRAPWQPLRVELGYEPDDTTVTVLSVNPPRLVAQGVATSAEAMLRTFAGELRAPAKLGTRKNASLGGGQVLIVFGPEHAWLCVDQGWSAADVRSFVHEHSGITLDELAEAGIQIEDDRDGATRGQALRIVESPDDVLLVTAGGEGAGFSVFATSGFPLRVNRAVTRRVRPAGEPLPDCGPDGCIVPAAPSLSSSLVAPVAAADRVLVPSSG
jgi:hypothetical protein